MEHFLSFKENVRKRKKKVVDAGAGPIIFFVAFTWWPWKVDAIQLLSQSLSFSPKGFVKFRHKQQQQQQQALMSLK
jgi:hypothetical protein